MESVSFPVGINTFHYVSPTIDFYYPVVTCIKDLKVLKKINQQIYHQMMKLISELEQPDVKTYIAGSYEVKTNERNILSIYFSGGGDFHGAHPVNGVRSINMDVKTGKVYELKDLFKPDSDYIKILSDIGYKEIKEQGINLYEDGYKGVRPDQDYYIADQNLIIYFQQYEIGPRPSGFPYFSVPIYQIKDLIPEDGILNRMIEYF